MDEQAFREAIEGLTPEDLRSVLLEAIPVISPRPLTGELRTLLSNAADSVRTHSVAYLGEAGRAIAAAADSPGDTDWSEIGQCLQQIEACRKEYEAAERLERALHALGG